MRNVNLVRHLPWLVLSLLLAAGSTLWLLFVGEQQNHLKVGFQAQVERLSDELLRGRLEGKLGQDSLPEGIRLFAVYNQDGQLVASLGLDAPGQVDPAWVPDRLSGRILARSPDGWVDYLRVLQPLRPRPNLMGDPERDDDPGPLALGPGRGPRRQGYLLVRVNDGPLAARQVAWTAAAVLGLAAWAGFLAFVGLLWFRARRYQNALIQHRELLQFAEASRTLSHELQNPLAAILLQTALLKRASGQVAPEVAVIEEEAQRMSHLVARVRDFLKDPEGQPEQVDLGAQAQALAGRFAVPVQVEEVEPGPFLVTFDAHRLRSVVENLLKNAVESGDSPSPRLRLSRPRPAWVRLEVLDSGRGFTAESLRNALNPFYTTKTTGTGIGLSITDSFVRAAGGRLKLENRPEGGARVVLDLPEARPEAAA